MRLTFPVLALLLSLIHCASFASAKKPSAKSPAPSAAPKAAAPAPRVDLDSNRVHTLYQDGDFEQAIAILTAAMESGKIRNHSDSVFVFKHLGVMYAANADTRERGKYYMMQLLTIEPTARIMDMYASDMIYMIFRNIQEEVETSQSKYRRAQAHVDGNRAPDPHSPPAAADPIQPARPAEPRDDDGKKSYAWAAWTGAAVVAIGAGVAVYIVTASETQPTKKQQVE